MTSTRMQQAAEAFARGEFASAADHYRALLAGRSDDRSAMEAAMGLAACNERLGRTAEAIEGYRRIVKRWPGNVPARYLLGNQLKAQGKFDEARSIYERIMAKWPDYTQAHFTYSGIHRYRDPGDPHIARMVGLLQSGGLPVENQAQIAFALAKAFEDLEDHREAFRYLEIGNRLRRSTFHYAIDSDAELFDNIIRTFNRDDVARLRVDAPTSSRPIFIVGMVRSGTSLVEKILASHPAVHGAGELEYVFSMGVSMFLDPSNHYQFRPLGTYPASTFESFGRTYLARLDALNDQAPRVTDKMPFNMMMVGLIRAALPNAKIIHCVRDPRDTCVSIYRQNFATGNYRFAYDLETIGQFHNLYRRLMRHWHAVYPGAIYDVCYESLVRDPEAEIRKLLAACDLDWNDACLDFHATPGVVRTASFYQVRQPMYTRSVGVWERYREHLQPLLQALEPE